MCGMSGCAGSIFHSEKSTAEHLMTFNIPRGPHSTGMAVIPRHRNQHQNVMVVKELGTPFGDLDGGGGGIRSHKNYEKALRMTSMAILSHNRWATKGAISRKNAHPFWFPKLVGTHNGTLDYSYRNKLLRAEQYETDSECLFNSMNCWGVRKTIENTEGAYALVWFDLEKNTINFIRNEKRPLHYAFSGDRQTLFWSSDFHALAYGMEQGRINRKDEKIYLLATDTWMSWRVPEANQVFGEPHRETLKGYETKYTYSSHKFQGGSQNHGNGTFPDSSPWDGWADGASTVSGGETESDTDGSDTSESVASTAVGAATADHGTTDDSKILETEFDLRAQTYSVDRSEASGKATVIRHNVTDVAAALKRSPKVQGELEGMAERRFDEMFGSPVLTNTNLMLKVSTPFRKCWYDKVTGNFDWYEYLTLSNKWLRHETTTPPKFLPLTKLDIESGGSHLFSYQKTGRGKKKKRLVFYKGYQGNLLPQEKFSELMIDGCLNCQRSPEWGNPVKFLDHNHFLCEHCTTPHLETLWKKA